MDQAPYINKNSEEQLARVKRDMAVLYEVSNAMRTSLELNHILYIILTGVTAHTGLGFNRAVLFLINQKENCLEPRMAIGPESGEHAKNVWEYISKANQHIDDLIHVDRAEENLRNSSLFKAIRNLKFPLNNANNLLTNSFVGGVPVHLTPEMIKGFQHDPLIQFLKATELVIMPLRAKDKVNGIIIADNLYTQKEIDKDDLRIFQMLANQAGLAIENSRLYEMVINKSHTDSITGLWNHGFFQQQLTKEITNILQSKNSLSLLMLDIDNFKKLNDTLGHQNGDLVLKEIASVLKSTARDGDSVCRYGGEEFAIILSNTNKDAAYAIAERIRQRIEQHKLVLLPKDSVQNVTVSIGLASLPADANNKEDLIAKADKAMYIAKFSGKNRTCVE